MNLLSEIRLHRKEILELAARHGASNVRVFGSVARGQADEKSDIDFLIDFDKSRSLLKFGALWVELEELLQHKVDVVPSHRLRERIRERVLREAVPL